MPADPRAYKYPTDQIRRMWYRLQRACTAREAYVLRQAIDEQLDYWHDITHLATEWDADKWGFDVDRWLRTERGIMARVPMYKGIDGRWYPCP